MSGRVEIGAKLTLDSAQALENVGKVKQAFKEAQKALHAAQAEFGEFSNEAVQAAKAVAGLKDKLGDAANLVDAFNPDKKFQAFSNALQGVAGGFSAVQGAMGLLGIESEDVQKQMMKVQAAMAFSQGINSVLDSIQSFKSLGIVIQATTVFQKINSATNVMAAGIMRALGIAAVTTGTAFKTLKAILVSTGIGALVIGIGLLISKISDWVGSTNSAKAAQDRLNSSLERYKQLLDDELKGVEYVTKARTLRAKLAGKSEKELTDIEANGQAERLKALKDNVNRIEELRNTDDFRKKANLETTEKINNEYLAASQAYYDETHKQELDGLQKQVDVNQKRQDEAKRRGEEGAARNKQAIEKQRAAAEAERKQTEADKLAAQQLIESLKKDNVISSAPDETQAKLLQVQYEYDEKKKIIEKGEGDITALNEWAAKKRQAIWLEAMDTDIQARQADAEKTKASEQALLDAKLEHATRYVEAHRIATQWVASNENMSYAERRSLIASGEATLSDTVGISEAQRTAMEQNFSDARKQIATHEAQHKQTMANLTAGALSAFSDLAGQQTGIGKTLAVAATTISTYQAAQDAYRNQMLVPDPSAQFRAVLAASAAVAVGLVRIKGILSVKVPGASGSAPTISGGGAPLSPQLGNNITRLDQSTINNLGNQAIRTFVTETDMTTNQETIRRINRAAKIG